MESVGLIRIGRQALSWGSALFINPSDPMPQTLAETPWQERTGFDAVYISHPMEIHGEQRSLVPSIDCRESLYSFNLHGREALLPLRKKIGKDGDWNLAGDKNIGWWGEFAWHQEENPYLKANVGIDYFLFRWVVDVLSDWFMMVLVKFLHCMNGTKDHLSTLYLTALFGNRCC